MTPRHLVVPRAETAHAFIWLRLSNTQDPDVGQAANDLQQLRRARNLADYDLVPCTEVQASNCLTTAENVLVTLETLPTLPATHAAVVPAIREHERDVLREVTWRPPAGPSPP